MAPAVGHNNKINITGRQTNNSLASATGQIVIESKINKSLSVHESDSEMPNQTDEDLQTGMYKVLEYVKNHEDSWPFIDPVEEQYAPNYYAIIRRPMDLRRMEDKLDSGEYDTYLEFRADFQLLVNNCRLYNGRDNEYTEMVDNLQKAFKKAANRFLEQTSSEEEFGFSAKLLTNVNCSRPTSKKKLSRKKKKKKIMETKTKVVPKSMKECQSFTAESPKRKKRKPMKEEASIMEIKKLRHKHSSNVAESDVDNCKNEASQASVRHKRKKKLDIISKSKKISGEPNIKKKCHLSKSEKISKKKAGRPSRKRKKNKYKRKHSRRSSIRTNSMSKDLPKDTISFSEICESEDGVSSCNRSASPLFSCSDISDSEPAKDLVNSSMSIAKNYKENPPEKIISEEDKFDKIKENQKEKDDRESITHKKHKKERNEQRNLKLSDTIEKLRMKNEKIKERAELFEEIFGENDVNEIVSTISKSSKCEYRDKEEYSITNKKTKKKNTVSTTLDALDAETEQTLKDMNKWFTESERENLNEKVDKKNISTDNRPDAKKTDKDIKKVERGIVKKDNKDNAKHKMIKDSVKQLFNKKLELQRTVDRLQPGKAKGNLINNMNAQTIMKLPIECDQLQNTAKDAEKIEVYKTSPKLSLGSVLPVQAFSLLQQHSFHDEKQLNCTTNDNSSIDDTKLKDSIPESETVSCKGSDDLIESFKICQEKATPNLSAWFKAFGAPKTQIKKLDEADNMNIFPKDNFVNAQTINNIVQIRNKSETEHECGDHNFDSTEANRSLNTRRTSTGSSISDHSSFSQDLNLPQTSLEEQVNSSSPDSCPKQLSSVPIEDKVSKKSKDMQKSINVGFYQDMTIKSSPDKSCSSQDENPDISNRHYRPMPHTSSQNFISTTQYYEHSNFRNSDQSMQAGCENTISGHDSAKACNYANPTLCGNDRIFANPTNSLQRLSQSDGFFVPQNSPTYHNRNVDNRVSESSNSLSYLDQNSPYHNNNSIVTQHISSNSQQAVSPDQITNTFPVKKQNSGDHTNSLTNIEKIAKSSVIHTIDVNSSTPEHKPAQITNSIVHDAKIDLTQNLENLKKNDFMDMQQNYRDIKDNIVEIPRIASIPNHTDSSNQLDISQKYIGNAYQNYAGGTNQEVPSLQLDNIATMDYKQKYLQSPKCIATSQNNFSELNMIKLGSASCNTSYSKPTPINNFEFINHPARRLNFPGLHLNTSECQNNIKISNSTSVANNKVGCGAQVNLTTTRSVPAPINYNMQHNIKFSHLNFGSQNTRVGTELSTISDLPARRIPNIPQITEYYADNEYQAGMSYGEAKKFRTIDEQTSSVTSLEMYSHPPTSTYDRIPNEKFSDMSSQLNTKQPEPTTKSDKKTRSRKKKEALESDVNQIQGFQSYASIKSVVNETSNAPSFKTKNAIHNPTFNFGSGSTVYNASEGYLDDYRPNNNPYYLGHRSVTQEQNDDRINHPITRFQYLGSQTPRSADYPFIAPVPAGLAESSTPLYQQYLQRHQEDLFRQTNAQIILNQSLLSNTTSYASPRYHTTLGACQAYDPMNPRPPWL